MSASAYLLVGEEKTALMLEERESSSVATDGDASGCCSSEEETSDFSSVRFDRSYGSSSTTSCSSVSYVDLTASPNPEDDLHTIDLTELSDSEDLEGGESSMVESTAGKRKDQGRVEAVRSRRKSSGFIPSFYLWSITYFGTREEQPCVAEFLAKHAKEYEYQLETCPTTGKSLFRIQCRFTVKRTHKSLSELCRAMSLPGATGVPARDDDMNRLEAKNRVAGPWNSSNTSKRQEMHECSQCSYTSTFIERLKRHVKEVHDHEQSHSGTLSSYTAKRKGAVPQHEVHEHDTRQPSKKKILLQNLSKEIQECLASMFEMLYDHSTGLMSHITAEQYKDIFQATGFANKRFIKDYFNKRADQHRQDAGITKDALEAARLERRRERSRDYMRNKVMQEYGFLKCESDNECVRRRKRKRGEVPPLRRAYSYEDRNKKNEKWLQFLNRKRARDEAIRKKNEEIAAQIEREKDAEQTRLFSQARQRMSFESARRAGQSISPEMQAHFATLGLVAGSSMGEVKAAYFKLAKRLHPDKHRNSDEATRLQSEDHFKRASAAYNALCIQYA